MRILIAVAVAVVVMGVSVSKAICAESYPAENVIREDTPPVVFDAGNKVCPVLGEKVDGKNFYTYNGKRYGLCCPMCQAEFEKDPAKYSAIADKEINTNQ
jgi:YHS domain-containing protein